MVAKKKSGIEHTKTTSSVFLPYSSFAVILSVFLMLSSFTTDIAFSIPNRYNIPLVVNHPPVVKAGPDQTVEENGTVVLHGIANDSDPGDIISYSWRQMAGHAVKLSSSNSKNPSFIAPKVSVDTQLRFALTARDDRGATSITPANVTITVEHINRALVANAGTDQTVNAGYVVILDGSKSRDQDNDPLTYTWKETEGTPVVLNGANTSIATFTAPKGISSDTDMTFELTVTDSKNATNTSTVKVTAKYVPPPNQPSIANAGLDQTVNAGDKVILYGSGSKDPDGTIISYSWKQSSGPSVALNSSDRGGKTFSAPPVLSVTTYPLLL